MTTAGTAQAGTGADMPGTRVKAGAARKAGMTGIGKVTICTWGIIIGGIITTDMVAAGKPRAVRTREAINEAINHGAGGNDETHSD